MCRGAHLLRRHVVLLNIYPVIALLTANLRTGQNSLNERRKQHKNGGLNLMTCMMMTSAAFDLVRRAEDNIMSHAPRLLAKPHLYDVSYFSLVFFADFFAKAREPSDPK